MASNESPSRTRWKVCPFAATYAPPTETPNVSSAVANRSAISLAFPSCSSRAQQLSRLCVRWAKNFMCGSHSLKQAGSVERSSGTGLVSGPVSGQPPACVTVYQGVRELTLAHPAPPRHTRLGYPCTALHPAPRPAVPSRCHGHAPSGARFTDSIEVPSRRNDAWVHN